MKKKTTDKKYKITGTYITQPISQPDSRQPETNVAMPDDENVAINRKWIEENKK